MRVNGRAVLATLVLVLVSVSAVTFSYATLYPSLATDALGNSGSAEIGLNVKEFIKLAVDTNNLALKDEDNNTIITPTTSGTLISGDVNLAVTTNTEKGYSLSVYTADNTKAMSHSNSGIEASIAPVDTAPGYNATNGISSLANNTWGFRKLIDTNTNTGEKTYSNWYSIGSNSTNGTIIDSTDSDDSLYCDNLAYPLENTGCLPSSYNTYEVNFGAKLTNSLPAGTYANNVVFSAVAKSEGIKYRLIFNPNPTGANGGSNPSNNSNNTGGITGSMSPKTILAGSTTTLPKGTFEKEGKGIKGWALVDNATLSTTPIYDINSTVQVDTILADAETAGQTPDTNNNEINLYAVWDTAYTLEFQYGAEDVEGTPFTGTTIKSNNLTFPEYTAFSKEGYSQIGWALVENATAETTPLFEENQTISISNLITAANNAGQSVSPDTAGKIVLYAAWGKDTMQNWAGCSTLQVNQVITLTDSRDNHEYRVKKLPDGKCWMIDNLTLTATDLLTSNKALTSANTNISSSDANSYYIPPKNTRYTAANSIINSNVAAASTSVYFNSDYSNYPQVGYRDKDSTNNSTGSPIPEDTAYYNFYTATLGYSYYNDGKISGSSPRDICPKGWKLPWVSDNGTTASTSGYFQTLANAYNSDAHWSDGNISDQYRTTDTTILRNMVYGDASSLDPNLDTNGAAGFTYTGVYRDTSLNYVGTSGYYLSSSIYNTSQNYFLSFNNNSILSPQNVLSKEFGFSVRCVARETNTLFDLTYMQDINDDIVFNTPTNKIVSLKDKRDNHEYKVKKLPDGKIWMIQNLTLSATDLLTNNKALTSTDTNILSYDTNSYYIPPKNARYATAGSITTPNVATASTSVNFGNNSYSNHPQVGYRDKDSTDNSIGSPIPEDTAYYNFYTATLGYSYFGDGITSGSSPRDICPKGWKLPWASDNGAAASTSGYFQVLMKSYNSNASWSNNSISYDYRTSDPTIRQNMVYGDASSLDPNLDTNGAAGFTYTGVYSGTSLNYVGTGGYYWTSSVKYTYDSYLLLFNATNVSPQEYNNKGDGYAVRCVTGH